MYTAYRLNWYILLCVLGTFLASTIGELTRSCHPDVQKRGNHICGPMLSQALSMVCKHGYHWQKRSVRDTMTAPDNTPATANDWELEAVPEKSPFMDKHLAISMLHNRGKRGIVCECCKHKCSLQELSEYCKLPSRGSKRSLLPHALAPAASANAQDQVTSNSFDDDTWALEDASQSKIVGADNMETQTEYSSSSSLTQEDLDRRTDSHIGRLVRLLLQKSSLDATN